MRVCVCFTMMRRREAWLETPFGGMLWAQAGSGPLDSKIPANLRANFSSQYLSQKVDGRTRKEVGTRRVTSITPASHQALLLGDHHVLRPLQDARSLCICNMYFGLYFGLVRQKDGAICPAFSCLHAATPIGDCIQMISFWGVRL